MTAASDTESQVRRVGAYAKLLANYASDDAIIEAGEAAELLFVRGLAFLATADSDGYITHAQVSRYVGAGMRDAAKRAQRLATVGVWQPVDGGYMVRSWNKIHETAADKGRRRKHDRERKARPDSGEPSGGIPDGIRAEGVSDSLSLIQSSAETRQDTTAQDESTLGGERPVTLRAVDVTIRPTCSKHPAGDPGTNCQGCRRVREWDEREMERLTAAASRLRVEAIAKCPDCHGSGWIELVDGSPASKCNHRGLSVTA